MLSRLGSVLLALVLGVGVLATTSAPASAAPRKVAAASLLKRLAVVEEKDADTYDRDLFEHWTMRRGGCTVRNAVLITESRVTASRTGRCKVTRGRWRDEYSGRTLRSARSVQIDHRVALAEAWRSGASRWSESRRRGFANDTAYGHSLLAASARTNQAKSAHDPASWLPARGKCQYVARWVAVKYRWRLTVDRAEHTALSKRLKRCGTARTKVARPRAGAPEGEDSPPPPPPPSPGNGSVPPVSEYDCPASHPIKGNANSMIYHVPGGQYYGVTKPEECFATESAAQAAGYRASRE